MLFSPFEYSIHAGIGCFGIKKPPVQLCRDCTGGRLKFD